MFKALVINAPGISECRSKVQVTQLDLNLPQIAPGLKNSVHVSMAQAMGRKSGLNLKAYAVLLKHLFHSRGLNPIPDSITAQEQVSRPVSQLNSLAQVKPKPEITPRPVADGDVSLPLAFSGPDKNTLPFKINILNKNTTSLVKSEAGIVKQGEKGQVSFFPPPVKVVFFPGQGKNALNFALQVIKEPFDVLWGRRPGQLIRGRGWGQILKGILAKELFPDEVSDKHLENGIVAMGGAVLEVCLVVVNESNDRLKSGWPLRANSPIGGQSFAVKNLCVIVECCLSQKESLNGFLKHIRRLPTIIAFLGLHQLTC